MAQHVVTIMSSRIDFAPATVAAEVVQNVRTIIATHIGTVPLFRDFGVSWDGIDRPLPVARAIVRAAVIEAIQKYEPRAVVDSVTWPEGDDAAADAMEGIMRPTVTISLADGVEDSDLLESTALTVGSVYRQADRAVALARQVVLLEQSIASRIIELEVTDYVRIFNLGNAERGPGGLADAVSVASQVRGASLIDSIVMMLDTSATLAAQVQADVYYYTRVLHEFERVDYTAIYEARNVTHDDVDIKVIEPDAVTSAVGVTELEALSVLANSVYADVIAARDALLGLERVLGEFERTDYSSIYDDKR